MDIISGLPDDLLLKILSFVPTKVAVSTSILSKRWEFLWMWLLQLDYDSEDTPRPGLRDFIDKNLPLHGAPVIESLCLGLIDSKAEDIKRWVEIAVSRHVRELKISHYKDDSNVFPSSFYTYKSLVSLKLNGVALVDVPSMVCLPSLKHLLLNHVAYANDETLQQFLNICPVLEDLSVRIYHDDFEEFTIIVPALQILWLSLPDLCLERYVIDTPSLKRLILEDWDFEGHHCEIKDMPKLYEAYVDDYSFALKSVIKSITSVKHLTICSQDHVYGEGVVFNQLECLNLCVCKKGSPILLGQLLKDSPKLRVLQLFRMEISFLDKLFLFYFCGSKSNSYAAWSHQFIDHEDEEHSDMGFWNQPSSVPECLLSSLENFYWYRYFGRPKDRDLAVYILQNARRLKKAFISADPEEYDVPGLKLTEELTLSPRASSTCELEYNEDKYRIEDN